MFANVPGRTVKGGRADFWGHLSFAVRGTFKTRPVVSVACSSGLCGYGGFRWNSDRYFAGGTEFHRAAAPIFRFPDQPLFEPAGKAFSL